MQGMFSVVDIHICVDKLIFIQAFQSTKPTDDLTILCDEIDEAFPIPGRSTRV